VLTKEQRQLVLGALSITKGFIEEIKKDKVKVVVSATSWTADEDFQMFLDALVGYSALATSKKPNLPELLVVITGKGPMQKAFLRQVTELKGKDQLERVNIKTAWMSTTDYAGLLAAADLGVSMHMSSSGVDFPMKVIDMFGAGLPVLGWNKYEAWAELVEEGVNGKGFGSGEELKQALVELLGKDGREIERLRQGARKESVRGWDDEWDEGAGKVLDFK
jgi:beta-1,4-mannosyltransferase